MSTATPTGQAYTELQAGYDYFNHRLFGSELPSCLITMQRKNRTYGYFSGDRWANQSGSIRDEIAMNPMHFASRSVEDVLSTLVHEMVHVWQYHCGRPSRSGYHNKEWAAKMEAIGLCPSRTGKPDGKWTGQQMSHYILAGGPFAVSCATLLKRGFTISWMDRAREEPAGAAKLTNTRTKYTCPVCEINAWAKPDVVLICGECNEELLAEE